MVTKEIPKHRWNDFTRNFSRTHQGWMMNLDVFDLEIGAQRQLENWPLGGVTYEGNDADAPLIISGSDRKGNHLTHPIAAPGRLWLEQRDDGADMGLVIESAAGRKTVLQFQHPLLSDMLDPAVE